MKDWAGWLILIAIIMATYYFVDATWLNPQNYSSDPTPYDGYEPGNIYVP